MPKLPDYNDLGARPVPVSRRGVSSRPRPGAIGQAVEGLGQTVGNIGQGMLDQQDKLAYSTARATLLREDIAARKELENEPDYTKWSGVYETRMKAAKEKATGLIQSRSDRLMFEADAGIDLERGRGEIGTRIRARENDAALANGSKMIDGLEDAYQSAADDASREAVLGTMSGMIDGLRDKGVITAVQAQEMRQQRTMGIINQRTQALIGAGELESAETFMTLNRGRMDSQMETRLWEQLRDKKENREVLSYAEAAVAGTLGGAAVQQEEETGSPPAILPNGHYGVAGWRITDRPGSARPKGRKHAGWDLAGMPVGTPVAAPLDGEVVRVAPNNGNAGNMVTIRYANGKVNTFMHLDTIGVQTGQTVKAGQTFGTAGNTGRTTTKGTTRAVLHVEGTAGLVNGGAASSGPRQAPKKSDLNAVFANIDRAADEQGWTPERREATKAQAGRIVSRNESLYAREQEDILDKALTRAGELGAGLTNRSQLGQDYYRLDRAGRDRIDGIIEANTNPKNVDANGPRALQLDEAMDDPATFVQLDLRQYQHELTPSEYRKFLNDQRTIREQGAGGAFAASRSAITSTINFYGPDIGISGDDVKAVGKKRERYLKLKSAMEADLRRVTGGAKEPTPAEVDAAFHRATMKVMQDGEESMRFEIDAAGPNVTVAVPKAVADRIRSTSRMAGRPAPTPQEVAQIYMRNKGKPGFW